MPGCSYDPVAVSERSEDGRKAIEDVESRRVRSKL